ncbi:50S ribosomal protein L9, partial [Peribacillus frigoritolerans]
EANNSNVKTLEAQKNKEESLAAEELQQAEELKVQLEKLTVELSAKAGEGGRLFGSITTKQIASELQKKHGIKVDKRKMELAEGIRTLGHTKLPVKLHPEVTATLTVHVKEIN